MNSYAGGVAPFWSAILTFHSLDRGGQLFSTSPEVFRMQVGALLEARIPIVPLEQIQQVDGAVAFRIPR
jgi:hypothetical protein